MIRLRKRGLALIGTAALVAATVGVVPATGASAQPRTLATQATPFANASFLTYGTGAQIHLDAVNTGATKLTAVDQAFSAVSANSGGLGTMISDPQTGSLVQPSLPTANAYGRGSGLEVGLGLPAATANQLKLGIAEASAPPIGPPVIKTVVPINLPGVLTAGVLTGIASAAYSPTFCPVGQPLAYGEGDAAGVGLLGTNPPLVSASGNSTQTAQSQSRSDLTANTDGTFGLQTTVEEHVAPVSINLGTGVSLQVSVGGSGINLPITLKTGTDGEGHNFSTFTNTGTVTLKLVALGATTTLLSVDLTKLVPGGIVIKNSTLVAVLGPTLGGIVGSLLTTLGLTLDIEIGAAPTTVAGFPTGPNSVSADFNLVKVTAALGTLGIANLEIGHMETGVDLASGAISCNVPLNKTANPTTVVAGNTFTWNISIPANSASLADSTCDLVNISASDKISVDSGNPSFTIQSISNGGIYNTSTGTVTWTGLGPYVPGTAPIVLTITVAVPANSPAGVLRDTVNVAAGLGNCTGGPIKGVVTEIGAVGNAIIGGSFTLIGPSVSTASGGSNPLAATGTGPELAWLAAGLLVLAEGTRRLLRRTRRAQ